MEQQQIGARVRLKKKGRVALILFANPPTGTISNGGALELLAAVREALADPETGAIVIAGGLPRTFIRHADVRQIAASLAGVSSGALKADAFAESGFFELGTCLDMASKPVIAAIDGACMGGGFETALACTMRIASSAVAAIGLPEVKLGIFPGGGGTQRLSRLIGRHRARLFILKGEVVDAEAALAMGLIDEVSPVALDRALEVAALFAGRSPAAVAAILDLTATDEDLPDLRAEALAFGRLGVDDDGLPDRLHRFVASEMRLETLE